MTPKEEPGDEEERAIQYVRLPMMVECIHNPDSPENVKLIRMLIRIDDPEVPTYVARCPICGHQVMIAFEVYDEEKGAEEPCQA